MDMKKRTVMLLVLIVIMAVLWFVDIDAGLIYEGVNPLYTLAPYRGTLDLIRQSLMIQSSDELPEVYVTDTYTLTNPLEESSTVSLMLPVQNEGLNPDAVKIRIGGEDLDYSIKWLNDSGKYDPSLEVNKDGVNARDIALDLENDKGFVYKNIVPADKIWVYEVELGEENNKIRIENKSGDLNILYMGEDDPGFKVSKGRNSAEFVLNRTADSKYSIALLNGEDDDIRFETGTQYRKKQMRLSEYVRQCVNRYMSTHPEERKDHLNNVREVAPHVMYSIDVAIGNSEGSSILDLNDMFINHVNIISFDVEFEAGETRIVEIFYRAKGIFDQTRLENPMYTFRYRFSPVDSWMTCGHTMMSVLVGSDCKYMIESSVPFEYQSYTNKYTAVLDSAPDEAVSYSIYEDDVELKNEINIGVRRRLNAVSAALVMVLVVGVVMVFAARKRKDI